MARADSGGDRPGEGAAAAERKRRRWGGGTILTIVVLGGFVAAAAGIAWYIWTNLAGTEISTPGIIALVAGATVTVLLGVGLMSLVFLSDRRGFDDAAGGTD